jgi:competence protein ComEC
MGVKTMRRPLVPAALGYTAGIILRDVLPLPMGFLLLSGLAAAGWWLWNRYCAWRKSPLPFLACWLIFGMVMNQWAVQRTDGFTAAVETGRRAEFTGTVIEEPVQKGDRTSYVVKVDRVRQDSRLRSVQGRVLLNLRGSAEPLAYGDLIRFYGVPELPAEPGNPGQFDYRKYLYDKGIRLMVNGWGDGSVQRLAAGRGSPLVAAALTVKSRLVRVLDETLPPEKSALLKGVLFGSRAEIDPVTEQEFVDTGVVHILSVSGYHVGLVLAGCSLLNGLLKLNRISFVLFSMAILIFYAVLTGVQPAVIRATAMALVLLAGHYLDRDRDWATGLALAALVILVANPRAFYNVGFQFSFAATWGILYLSPFFQKYLFYRLPRAWRPAAAVPLAAQLAALPLSAYYFNQVSAISLAANVIIVPLVGMITILGVFAVLGGVVWTLWAEVLNISTGFLLTLMIKLNSLLAGLPGAVLYMKKPPLWAVVLWFAGLIMLMEGFYYIPFNQLLRRFFIIRGKIIVTGIMALLPVVVWAMFYQPPGPLTVTFIDVGQGDSILIRTPRGRVMLIDTGGGAGGGESGFDMGAKILVPVLRNHGVSKIDALVFTHLHLDHIGGAPAVLERLKVKRIVTSEPLGTGGRVETKGARDTEGTGKTAGGREPGGAAEDKVLAEITALAGKASVPVMPVGAGDRIMLDPHIRIEVLAPQKNRTSGGSLDSNNSSIVLKLSYGQDSILLTGDIEAEAMELLLAGHRDLRADVLKIPHHGSRGSLSDKFYQKVDPDLAVISVGRNLFGHPSGEVLAALKANDIRVTRTDLQGAVTLISEGHGWSGQTVKKGEI